MENDQINSVVKEYAQKTTRPEDVAFMADLLEKSIQNWIKEYSSMGFYKEEDYTISDIMLFANSKDKVLIFVEALLKDSDDGEVKLIAGRLHEEDDKWHFRYSGMPSFYYEYRENLRKGKKFTHEEIMSRTIDQLVDDGLVNFFGHISQDYLSKKWF